MPEEDVYTPSAEEVQSHYNAAMDSVNLINGSRPEDISDEDYSDMIDRNVRHLELMVEKDYWDGQDMDPLNSAITTGKAIIAGL